MDSIGLMAALAGVVVVAFGLVYLATDRIAKFATRWVRGPKTSVREGDDPLG